MKWIKIVLLVSMLFGAGCHKSARTVAVVSPPPAPAPDPPATPPTPAIPAALLSADAAYEKGDFDLAARSYDEYFQTKPESENMELSLFRFGISQSLSSTAAVKSASNTTFNQLIREFPNSLFVSPAKVILSLRAEISGLQVDRQTQDALIQASDEAIRQAKDIISQSEAKNRLSDERIRQSDDKIRQLEDKIRQLNDQLETLKRIDLDRRRTP